MQFNSWDIAEHFAKVFQGFQFDESNSIKMVTVKVAYMQGFTSETIANLENKRDIPRRGRGAHANLCKPPSSRSSGVGCADGPHAGLDVPPALKPIGVEYDPLTRSYIWSHQSYGASSHMLERHHEQDAVPHHSFPDDGDWIALPGCFSL